jgi:hypothetical protein
MGGDEMLYYSVFRSEDGMEMTSGLEYGDFSWIVESENEQLKIMVEETLKEVDRTISFQEYLDEYSK